MPNAESESSAEKESANVAKIGVEGGTRGLLFNDDDNDDGSCLTAFELTTAMAGVLFIAAVVCAIEGGERLLIGMPFNKHFLSNS